MAEVVDAGEVDAGAVAVAPIVDAGVAPKQAHVEVALPPDEQAELTRLRADLAAGRFESLWDTRTPIRLRFKSAGGKRQMVEFFIELACARADNQQVKLLLNEYRGMPGASLRTMKQTCLKRYPAAADLDW